MSDTSARASRFAFWFGSFARNGLIGDRPAGVASALPRADDDVASPSPVPRIGDRAAVASRPTGPTELAALPTALGGAVGCGREIGAPIGTPGRGAAGGACATGAANPDAAGPDGRGGGAGG